MSYDNVSPASYETYQQGTPWHAGAPGWTQAPFPGWGNNPNLVGQPFLATSGLGAYYAERSNLPISGLGGGCAPCAAAGLGVAPDTALGLVGAGVTLAMIAGLVWFGRAVSAEMQRR